MSARDDRGSAHSMCSRRGVAMDDASSCPEHGRPTRRGKCRRCNAGYMRGYLRLRRNNQPEKEMWNRARNRAAKLGVSFSISVGSITIPSDCPVLGLPLTVGGKRTRNSPSLDRVDPAKGYVPGNIRVISDHANRLKGSRTHKELRRLAELGRLDLRRDYLALVEYLKRERLLAVARRKQVKGVASTAEWREITALLELVCTWGLRETVEAERPPID